MNKLKKILIKLFVSFAFFLSFFISTLGAYIDYKKVNEMKTWTQISATIIASTMEEDHRSKGTTYCPSIIVEYSFQGKILTSKLSIESGECNPVKTIVENKIKLYSQGVIVNTFINPKKPSEIRAANYSLGLNFYLMLFIAVITFYGLAYVLFTPVNKLMKDKKELL